MKYTRYDIKRKNNSNFVFGAVLVCTLVFAFLIGTVISNLFIKNSTIGEVPQKPKANATEVVNIDQNKKSIKYTAVQGGVFSKPENAESVKISLGDYGNPFTVQDAKGTRVILGIYLEEKAATVFKNLNEKSVPNSKINFEVMIEDTCDYAITEIIRAELDVLSKLEDKSIKSIQTEELKKWCAELKDIDDKSRNISVFNELKSHIDTLPKELEREKAGENYKFVYTTLIKMVKK